MTTIDIVIIIETTITAIMLIISAVLLKLTKTEMDCNRNNRKIKMKTKDFLSRVRARNTRVYETEKGEKEKMDESLKSLASCAEKLGTSFDSFSHAAETFASASFDERESPPDDLLLTGLKRKWDESDYAHAKRIWDMSDKRTKFAARTKYHISFSDSSEKEEIVEETVLVVGPSGDTVLSWDFTPKWDYSPRTLSSAGYTTKGVYYDPYTNTVYADAVKPDTVNTVNTATTTLDTTSITYTPEVISAELVSKVGAFITTSNSTSTL